MPVEPYKYINGPTRRQPDPYQMSQQSEKFLMAQSRKFLLTDPVFADDRGTNRYEREGTRFAAVVVQAKLGTWMLRIYSLGGRPALAAVT